MSAGWAVEEQRGPAGALHQASADLLAPDLVRRRARVLVAEQPAVVLGSHEPDDWFDRSALRAAGLDLARRRSGGGAVMVGAGLTLWVDFVVPAGDALWDDDVSRASWWVGDLWREAFALAGVEDADALTVWQGPMRRTRWSSVICFAGVGPGEVEIGGSKVVGVSQRRNRHGALFQSAVLLDWDPGLWLSLLSPAGRIAAGFEAGPPAGAAAGSKSYVDGGGVPADLAAAGRPVGAGNEVRLVNALAALLMT